MESTNERPDIEKKKEKKVKFRKVKLVKNNVCFFINYFISKNIMFFDYSFCTFLEF